MCSYLFRNTEEVDTLRWTVLKYIASFEDDPFVFTHLETIYRRCNRRASL